MPPDTVNPVSLAALPAQPSQGETVVITVTLSGPANGTVSFGISGSPTAAFSSIPGSNTPAAGSSSFQFSVVIATAFRGSCTVTVSGAQDSPQITFDI